MDFKQIRSSISGYSGFNIVDSHFRLGSKIHLNDFIYAKKMFQQSFYAHKFAFTVCYYILNNKDFLSQIKSAEEHQGKPPGDEKKKIK